MEKQKSITSFFKRANDNNTCTIDDIQNKKRCKSSTNEHEQEPPLFETSRPNIEDVDLNYLERDPGKRIQIWNYPVDKREQVRRFYLNKGPFQIQLDEYPAKGTPNHPRRFRYSWFGKFPNWLEYSPTRDAAYCFFCYSFSDKPAVRKGSDAFIVKGYCQCQDIVNAMNLVAATKERLNEIRNNGWDSLLARVKAFSEKHEVDIPDLNALYKSSRYRPRQKDNHVTFEHYYRVDIFISTLDQQLLELSNRFNDQVIELLTLSSTLVPRKRSKVLNIDHICSLVEKYYPADFTEQERIQLKSELELFNIELSKNSKLGGASNLAEVCKVLVETEKCENYSLLYRLIRLILTLPVTTTTTERAFSRMKICKIRLRTKMSDDFLADNLVVYIECEIAEKFDSESVIDEFKLLKGRRAEL